MTRFSKYSALFVGTCFVVLIIHPASTSMAAESPPASLTTEELRHQLIEGHARIHAWYVEYESTREGPTGQALEAYVHRIVAARGPDRYFHWSSHGTKSLNWQDDPYQQRFVLNPSKTVVERPFHRQFRYLSLRPDEPLPGTMPQEFLFMALGWWPFPTRPMPILEGGISCGLPAITRSPKYVVNPRQELAGGRWCHVLEYPGHDRIWLDCGRGCSILARELFDPAKGILVQRIESSKHREIHPGIWVPFEFRNTVFDAAPSKAQGGNGVKIVDAILKVLKVRLNEQVQDSLFRFDPLPGSIQSLADDRTEQTIPGGTEYLDGMVNWINRHFQFSAISQQSSASSTEVVLEYMILGGAIVFLIGRFFRRRRPSGTSGGNPTPDNNPRVPEEIRK